jgi:hypothetical protein
MPHSTNLTFDLVELHGLKWFNFWMRPTMAAFHAGAFEVNPMVAHLITYLGRWRGVLASKLIAIAIAMGVRKRLWIVNVFYGVIILWNIIMIVALTAKR